MIAYLPLINLNFQPNFMEWLENLIEVVTFDIFPFIDEINEFLFTTEHSENEINQEAVGFGLLGLETHNYAKNTGSLWVFNSYMIATGVFFIIMRKFALMDICRGFYVKYRRNENLNA